MRLVVAELGGAEPLLGLPRPRMSCMPFHHTLCHAFQGVVEFSLCLLFAKLVSYTFLYWLPLYIFNVGKPEGKKGGYGVSEGPRPPLMGRGNLSRDTRDSRYSHDICGTSPRAKGNSIKHFCLFSF